MQQDGRQGPVFALLKRHKLAAFHVRLATLSILCAHLHAYPPIHVGAAPWQCSLHVPCTHASAQHVSCVE